MGKNDYFNEYKSFIQFTRMKDQSLLYFNAARALILFEVITRIILLFCFIRLWPFYLLNPVIMHQSLIQTLLILMHINFAAYCLVIGYCLRVFREAGWITWSAYAYVISSVIDICRSAAHNAPPSSVSRFLLTANLCNIPAYWSLFALWQVRSPRIASLCRWMVCIYVAVLSLEFLNDIFLQRDPPIMTFVNVWVIFPIFYPTAILFLIHRTQRWMIETQQLKKSVDDIEVS